MKESLEHKRHVFYLSLRAVSKKVQELVIYRIKQRVEMKRRNNMRLSIYRSIHNVGTKRG